MIIQGYEDVVCKFYDHVRLFFSALVRTLMKKIPFQSTLLSDMFCLNPKERHNQDFPRAIVNLAKSIPQLKFDEDKLDMLKTEAIDFQMSGNEDLPDTDDVDEFWAALHEVVSPPPRLNNIALGRLAMSLILLLGRLDSLQTHLGQ